jgi:16S rRNA (guanine527-N7)-methyltransferase
VPLHDVMLDCEVQARETLITQQDVSRETMEAFERYRQLLLKWAVQINLVGPSTLAHFWERHILDCAQLMSIMGETTGSVVDFGSGAGLPGLVIAKLFKDRGRESSVTLVEVSAKRFAFLREAARALDVHVTIIQEKIEVVPAIPVGVVTARAFAPLSKLLDYAQPWAELGARVVFLKGEDVQREIDEASTNWAFRSSVSRSGTDSRGCVIEISNLQRL